MIALALTAAPFFGLGTVAQAAGGLNISTEFPGVTVKAGETVSFTITVDNASGSPLNVGLKETTLPKGWTPGYFEGAGNTISRVYVKNGANAAVTYSVSVPSETPEGTNKLAVTADAGGGITDTLNLEVNVSKTEIVKGKFTSQYPDMAGPNSAPFKFSATINANSAKDVSYSLSANPPAGWTVAFAPSYEDKQITSITVAGGKDQGLDVTVTPPNTATAGEYQIPLTAVSSQDTLTTTLKVKVTGSYALEVSTPSGNQDVSAYAGQETPVTLTVKNTGGTDLSNINITPDLPTSDWAMRFDTATIDALKAGETKQVTAFIKPGANVIVGDYTAGVKAAAQEATTTFDLKVGIKTSTAWGIVGVVIILILIAGLFWVFRKFGRR